MKSILLLSVPVLLFADNLVTYENKIFNDLVYREPKINWGAVEVCEPKNDTSTKIISIDKNTVKIERAYTVKDTITYKR